MQFQSHSSRSHVPVEEDSLANRSRMPLKQHIVGRYQFLGKSVKGRKDRVAQLSSEVMQLWREKLNFPNISEQAVRSKLEKVLLLYDKGVRRGQFQSLAELFDITKVNGEWLNADDKKLYHIQIQSKGKVGYSTGKAASKYTIHPSKRRCTVASSQVLSNPDLQRSDSDSEEDIIEEYSNEDENESDGNYAPTRKHNKSGIATRLVTGTHISTRKSAKICKQLSSEGIDIPAPSQQGIHKALFRKAGEMKKNFIDTLHQQTWSLHFDGKRIDGTEYQAVVIRNETREIKLSTLKLSDGKAETIAEGLKGVLDEFHLWGAISMIIADTTSVNTGRKSGVVTRLQKMFISKGCNMPQFVSCQHHVLDRILRIVMDQELAGKTKSPNIEYFFVEELLTSYEEFQGSFQNGTHVIENKTGWRDDMKFLFHLTRAFRFFDENWSFPLIKFHKIPNISNARWNSRAILALLAFILMPNQRERLQTVCEFISYDWADHWFSDQKYQEDDYDKLSQALHPYKTALKGLKNHWKQEPSRLNISRSNQCCERAVKVMQDLYTKCKNKDNLPLRFILANNFP